MKNKHWLSSLLDPQQELEIVVFGFTRCRADWVNGPRSLPEDLIYVLDSGVIVGDAHLDGKKTRLRYEAGTAFWWPAGTIHHLHTAPGEEPPTVYHLRFKLPCRPQQPVLTRRSEFITQHMRNLYDDYKMALPDREARIRAQLALLLSEFQRAAEDGGANTLKPAQRRAVMQVVNNAAPDERPQPADLARAAGLSSDWFSRVFTRTYGCSPRSWLKKQRLQRAAERLAESTASISEIAGEFGYDELFRFSRQFREVMGCSPRSWRQRHQTSRRQR